MQLPRALFALTLAGGVLSSCADDNADRDGDGVIDAGERAVEWTKSGRSPLKPGQWEKRFVFDEIEIPSLNDTQKQRVMSELAELASGKTCLSEPEAANPGAQFFGGRGVEKCSYGKFEIGKTKTRLDINCAMEGAGAVAIEYKGKLGADRFEFDTEAKLRLPVLGAIKIKGKTVGRHSGSCTPNAP